MVRHLLEDRFGMKWHREMQERTVYAMTVGKGGLKLSPLEESKLEGQTSQFAIQLRVQDGVGVASSGVDLKGLASLIEPYVAYEGAFVVDETGIPGKFEGSVRFADPQSLQSSTLPDFKTALEEEWGIKLEKRKAPVEIIVIDHIERLPTEN
jgi:uncharacterized protein (TIGR03435 family)